MEKIFVCTIDTMEEDLLINGFEEIEIKGIIENIEEEIKDCSFTVDGNYVVGGVTATYLNDKYNINFIDKYIE